MSYSESYDACMGQKGLPLLGEVFSRQTLSEAISVLGEIQDALEGAGGSDITLAALAALGPSLGLSANALEVLGVLAGATVTITAHFYLAAAATCLATAIVKESLFSELDDAPDGSFKAAVHSEAREGTATA